MSETIPQWRQALNNANEIRLARAKIKRDVASGETEIWDIIEDPPEAVHTMTVFELVMCLPRYGKYRASRTMLVIRVSQAKTLGSLTQRQREEISRYFRYLKGSYQGL